MFPELLHAARALPANTVVDGEIVIADELGRIDFGALQARLTVARKHVSRTASNRPAVLVAFDVLELGGASLVNEPLSTRRCWLEKLVREHAHPCLQLMEQTSSIETAREWLGLLPTIEGVVAKRAESRYDTGRRRDWIKVKRHRTADCVVIGLAGDLSTPKLVLGLRHGDGNLTPLRTPRGVSSVIFKRTGVRGRRFVSTQAAGKALLGDGPYPADVRPLPNAEYVR